MNFLKKTILLIICISIYSCNGQTKKQAVATTKAPFTLDNLKIIPPDIEGCSCSYSESRKAFDDNLFLFVSTFEGVAYVSINHSLLKLKVIKSVKLLETSANSCVMLFIKLYNVLF